MYHVNGLYNNIRIVHERKAIDSQVHDAIKNAERVFFLGFGYAPENLEALGIGSVDYGYNYGYKEIYGTARGLSKRELDEVSRKLRRSFSAKDASDSLVHNVILEKESDCRQLLESYL